MYVPTHASMSVCLYGCDVCNARGAHDVCNARFYAPTRMATRAVAQAEGEEQVGSMPEPVPSRGELGSGGARGVPATAGTAGSAELLSSLKGMAGPSALET